MFAASVTAPGSRLLHCIQPSVWIRRWYLILLIPGTAAPSVDAHIMFHIPAAEVMILSLLIAMKPKAGASAVSGIMVIRREHSNQKCPGRSNTLCRRKSSKLLSPMYMKLKSTKNIRILWICDNMPQERKE